MIDDNAINPTTGETIYVGILEKLPEGFVWIHDMNNLKWLELVAALRSRLAEAEGVAKAMAGLIGGMEDDDPWIFSRNGGQEIMQAWEAYKSKHGQVVGT